MGVRRKSGGAVKITLTVIMIEIREMMKHSQGLAMVWQHRSLALVFAAHND